MADYVSPDWSRAALVVVDVQNDFLDDGAAAIPGTTDVLPAIAALTQVFREAGRPIAHVVRLYEPGGSDVDLPRRDSIERGARVVAPGTAGSQIPHPLLPAPVDLNVEILRSGRPQVLRDREIVVMKPRWSAFYRTPLESWLHDHDCDTVVVAGCNLPNCPRATLFDASERDFRAALVSDAVSQTSAERLSDLERIGVRTLTASALSTELSTIRTGH
ncbi:cysteine hydrolase [Georgenia halophila]|uniref:Cysteine hydrolase n=1 Tax=Georgenia halophila TaxID=620889 RepID=A0ABP8LDK7_9MICO